MAPGSESDPLAVEDGLREGPALDTSGRTPLAVGPAAQQPQGWERRSHTQTAGLTLHLNETMVSPQPFSGHTAPRECSKTEHLSPHPRTSHAGAG